jgi:hypothetical protein
MPEAIWKEIKDDCVRTVWKKAEDDDCECELEKIIVSVTFFQDNGTPLCDCGEDLEYSHTEIRP